jgi:hypothetical protein
VHREEAMSILGVTSASSPSEIRAAWIAVARSRHPDIGGTTTDMQLVNAAYRVLVGSVASSGDDEGRNDSSSAPRFGRRRHADHPSFVVDLEMRELHDLLVVASGTMGEVLDSDPHWLVEVHLREPVACWCRLELVPNGAGSAVGLLVEIDDDARPADADHEAVTTAVRDRFIDAINELTSA